MNGHGYRTRCRASNDRPQTNWSACADARRGRRPDAPLKSSHLVFWFSRHYLQVNTSALMLPLPRLARRLLAPSRHRPEHLSNSGRAVGRHSVPSPARAQIRIPRWPGGSSIPIGSTAISTGPCRKLPLITVGCADAHQTISDRATSLEIAHARALQSHCTSSYARCFGQPCAATGQLTRNVRKFDHTGPARMPHFIAMRPGS